MLKPQVFARQFILKNGTIFCMVKIMISFIRHGKINFLPAWKKKLLLIRIKCKVSLLFLGAIINVAYNLFYQISTGIVCD